MANKPLLGIEAGRPGTIGTADTGTIAGDAQITGNAQINGNLTVSGDIVSRGAVDVVLQDQFLELANGQTSTTAAAAGYAATISAASAITYNVASFTAPVTITLTADNTAGRATFFTGSAAITTNLTANDTLAVQNAAASASTFTAVASGASGLQFNVGADAEVTASNLATVINAQSDFRATAFGATILIQLVADAGGNSPTIVYTQVGGSGAVTAVNFSNNPIIPANTVIMISDLDVTSNDGIYAVASTAADTITIKNAAAVNSQAPFLQTAVAVGTESGANAVNFIDLYVQAVADGAVLRDPVGPVAKGALVDNFQSLATDLSFQNTYTIVGAGETTLQQAYDSGAAIVTDASGPVALTLSADNQGFSVQGSSGGNGDVSIGGTTAVNSFVVGASGAASSITSTGQNLTMGTATSGNVSLTSAGTSVVDSNDAMTIRMDADANAAKDILIQANNANAGGSATGNVKIDADDEVQLQIAAGAKLTIANATSAFTNTVQVDTTAGMKFGGSGTQIVDFVDQDAMTDNAANKIASQQSIKAYVDSRGLTNFATTVTMVADENIDFGEVVAVKISGGDEGRAILADPNAASSSSIVGICITAGTTGAAGTLTVATSGKVSGLSNVTAGAAVYASVSAAGALQSTAPTASGDTIYQIGYGTAAGQVALQLAFVAELA